MKKFWVVWREGGQSPKVQHESKTAAVCEAMRLSEKEGCDFYVLESVGRAGRPEIPVKYVDFEYEKEMFLKKHGASS